MEEDDKPPSENTSIQLSSELNVLRQVHPAEIFAIRQICDLKLISAQSILFLRENLENWQTQSNEPLALFEILSQTAIASDHRIKEMIVEGTVKRFQEDQLVTIPFFTNMQKLGAIALVGAIDSQILNNCKIEIHNSLLYFNISEEIHVELQSGLNNLCDCFDWQFSVNNNRIEIDFNPNSPRNLYYEEI